MHSPSAVRSPRQFFRLREAARPRYAAPSLSLQSGRSYGAEQIPERAHPNGGLGVIEILITAEIGHSISGNSRRQSSLSSTPPSPGMFRSVITRSVFAANQRERLPAGIRFLRHGKPMPLPVHHQAHALQHQRFVVHNQRSIHANASFSFQVGLPLFSAFHFNYNRFIQKMKPIQKNICQILHSRYLIPSRCPHSGL